jgi:predicted AlkP superfamily pyrophosphatase or phosphodiesterase
MRKLLVVQVAGLGWNLVERYGQMHVGSHIEMRPMASCFPALTCTAQAVFRTGTPPTDTAIVGNGRFDRQTRRTDFWNQSARLVRGRRIWTGHRAAGGRVGLLFWQQSLGEEVDLLLSPAPIHKHHGGMIQDCYGQPASLYGHLCHLLGRSFNLMHYWGPLASVRSSRWIVEATCAVLADPTLAPELLLTYLPHLDYVLQRHGPNDERTARPALLETEKLLRRLSTAARAAGFDILIWGDYAITAATGVVFPNRLLRERGLFAVRQVGGCTYPDLYATPAFAMVDHQVAHIYLVDSALQATVKACFQGVEGIADVRQPEPTTHSENGDLVLTAAPGYWFAYPWWEDARTAPDYARHVDIHNKIGFDPCELFWGWPPPAISLDATRVRGTHGRDDVPACSGSTASDLRGASTLLELAARLEPWLATDGN